MTWINRQTPELPFAVYLNDAGAFDDVVVGHRVAVGGDEEGGTLGDGDRRLAIEAEVEQPVGDRRQLAHSSPHQHNAQGVRGR